jgi:hypothetical protein
MKRGRLRELWPVALSVSFLVAFGCQRSPDTPVPASKSVATKDASLVSLHLKPEPIGAAIARPPWIAHVAAIDLDRDGLLDVVACEAMENQVVWIRQVKRGVFEERVVGTGLKAPVHVEAADVDGDGDSDLLVASMGYVFPNNDRIGTLFALENDGHQNFKTRTLLENTERITDVRAGDLNGDGRLDLVLAQFGYDQGSVSWLENTAPWTFRRHVLLELSGAINVGIADFNRDGKPDIVALVSQQWEEVHYFENTGGQFRRKRVWGSTNEDYGSSGLTVGDLNGDGQPDIVFTNGDGFGPAAMPGPRPWHGVQWLENTGNGSFRHQRIGTLPGAYSPLVVDLDGDGAMDVVTAAAYADRGDGTKAATAPVPTLVWFRQTAGGQFTPQVLATAPKDQITIASGDFAGDRRPELISGGFYVGPFYERMGRITRWRRE